jgi:DNA-binding NtrC family response regulator
MAEDEVCAPMSILFVDDEELLRSLYSRLLGQLPVRLRCAACADEALVLLEQEHPDLLVSDYQMPGRSGLDLIEQVRSRWPQVRSLLISGDPTAVASAQARGFTALLKPEAHASLLELVTEMLEHRRA